MGMQSRGPFGPSRGGRNRRTAALSQYQREFSITTFLRRTRSLTEHAGSSDDPDWTSFLF